MCSAANVDQIKECNVVYSQIPQLYEKPTIIADRAVAYKSKGEDMNMCTYTATVSEVWQTLMEKSGFEVVVNLYPQTDDIRDWTFDIDDAEWDDDTQNGLEGPTCTLYYTETAVDDHLTPELEAQVTIFLPEQGNLKANLTPFSKKLQKKTKSWWESTVSVDKSALTSLNKRVPMTDAQLQLGLQARKVFDLKWIDLPPIKITKKSAHSTLPSKLMSNMVIRQPLAGSANAAVEVGEHIVGSVRQVSELSAKITQLNQSPTKPSLKSVIPEAS